MPEVRSSLATTMSAASYLAYITCPDREEATRLARGILEAGLAAGINIIPGATSLYWWKGAIHEKNECLLLLQTTGGAYPLLERYVASVHSYETPCVCALPLAALPESLADWIARYARGIACE